VAGEANTSVPVRLSKTVATPVLSLLGPVKPAVDVLPANLPLSEGDKLGVIRYLQGSEVIASADVVAATSVPATSTP
jgi:hypothetical protein